MNKANPHIRTFCIGNPLMLQLAFKTNIMKKLFLILLVCAGCGSVQSINGISVKKKPNHKRLIVAGVATFAVGYQLGNQLIPKK